MLTRAIARWIGLESDEPRESDFVWFMRDVQGGQLRSWSVVAKCVKTKLQRLPDGQYEFQRNYVPGWTPDKAYQEMAGKQRVRKYTCDGWVIANIGHSLLARADLQRHCDALRADYALHLSWAQCQDFFRRFSSQILAGPGAASQWFMENTDPRRRSVAQLTPPPPRLVAEDKQRRQQQQQRNATLMANRSAMIAGMNHQIAVQNNQQLMMQNNLNVPGFGSY
ncbi:hypothetical protein MMC15_002072 [Xylographa vitiligo]|nr:hypothetical protein [Xylographa vitiligo]